MTDTSVLSPLIERWESLPAAKRRRYRTLGATVAAVATAAGAGTAATQTKTAWYRKLTTPWYQPPAWVFPIAWTALYADIAAVTGTSLADLEEKGRETEFRGLRRGLIANLILNVGWSVIFFVWKKPLLATLQAGLLALSSADLVTRSAAADRRRSRWLIPYPAWCTFATVLSFGIWRRNR